MSENNGTQTHLSQRTLNRAVCKAAEYVHARGWDHAPNLFAPVPTTALTDVFADKLIDSAPLTVVVQELLPEGIEGGSPELTDFIARTSWPADVVSTVLAQGVMVVTPGQADSFEGASLGEVRAQADGEATRQAHLFSGAISGGPHLTLIQSRPTETELDERGPSVEDEIELKDGSGIANGVTAALYFTLGSASQVRLPAIKDKKRH